MISKLLLKLIMMQSILARVDIEDIKIVSETLVGEKQDVIINPRGPLNLLRGYIGHQRGYMYNKRFYSSEIDTDYALSKNGTTFKNDQIYKRIRTPAYDRVYKDIATQTPNGKYLSTYHTQLIKMLPSVDGEISIEVVRSNSFTDFLRAEHVKKDAKYILAALLLLSEGVDIKIAVESIGGKKKLVIKSKTCEENKFVSVLMHAADINPATNKHSESIYQCEAAEIIDFYIQCRDNPLLKKGGEFAMPTTKEEFESGKFLNSAAFLIQTYIYEFIDTAESYKDFVNAVHELLVDQMAEKENPYDTREKGIEGRIFDELFIAKEALNNSIKYIAPFCDLVKAKNKNARFPFSNVSQLPRYTRVPQCKLDKSGFEKDQALYYSDCVESTLLGLFCCMAYNPETGEYQTSHMGERVSKELREFFEKYSKPKEEISFEMHKDWSRVVACLKNNKIDYSYKKNKLISGISNIFLAIAEITGEELEISTLVSSLELACYAKELNHTGVSCISDIIQLIIKYLSLNKDVEVECSQMRFENRSSGKTDILAQINITYNYNRVCNGISLNISQERASLTLYPSTGDSSEKIKEKYREVKNTYRDVNCYVGYISDQYVSAELDSLSSKKTDFPKNLKKIGLYPVIQEGSEGIYKIFLLGKFVSNEIKGLIINSFIDSTIDKEVAPTNPLTRFTANILGSVSFNDCVTRFMMVRHFPLHARWQEYYPKLGFKPSEHIPQEDAIWFCLLKTKEDLYNTLLDLSAGAALKAICNYLRAIANNARMLDSREDYLTRMRLFEHIVSNEGVDGLVEIQSILKRSMVEYRLNSIYIFWFIHVCSGIGEFSLESIKIVYDFLLTNSDYPNNLKFEEDVLEPLKYFEKTLNVLKENKTLFCSKDDRISMKKYDELVKYLKCFIPKKKTGWFSMF
ncbi:hypothetical protein NEAUS03_1499 [Nematocida ausubeli]|nr:hypothetical protein NEAUS03_1499 [Nematocida ausubeli]